MSSEKKVIAFFDFDGTLIKHDSLWPFLIAVAGKPKTFFALARALLVWCLRGTGERRTFVKAHLLRSLLKGKSIEEIQPAIQTVRVWMQELPTADVLRQHYKSGHHVVIASGSLDLYLPSLLTNMPHHAVLCTKIGVEEKIVTGEMTSGNCVRNRKAECVAAYIAEHGPFDESWGYGNLPHDQPMFDLLDHKTAL